MPSRRRVQPPTNQPRPAPQTSQPAPPVIRNAAPPKQPAARPQPARRAKRRTHIGLIVGALLVLAVVGGGVWWRTSSAAQQAASTAVGPVNGCRRLPRFTSGLGLGSSVSVSTTQPNATGLVLGNGQKIYQDPSWDDAGTLGPFALDREGNIYVAPVPRVAVTDIVSGTQSTIYRVDTTTGAMTPFITVPPAGPSGKTNVFGVLGLTYDCDTHSLYASTVAGSTRDNEVGQIVRIDLAQKTVVPEVSGVDALSVGVFNSTHGKRLYIGAARRSDVYLVALDRVGDVQGAPRLAFSFDAHDVYGEARVRRFSFDANETVETTTVPFAFNLRAGSDRLQQTFVYIYNATIDSWTYQPLPPQAK